MSIIISQNGSNAKKIDRAEIEKEDYLQNYIHENPESIPVYEIEEDKRLFVVAREFSTESGPIDALAIDKDGDIYVVETKLYKNPDKRTVVAQALDYGASLWRHSDYNEFIAKVNNEINKKFQITFEEKTKDFFSIDDEQVAGILEAIKINLQQGNIKFVILMDAIDDRLKDLIVYINQNSQFDIYAVQMEYYKFEKYEIMIPKIFGVEVKKSMTSSSAGQRKKWTKEDFLPTARKQLNEIHYRAVEKIFKFCEQRADKITMGTGTEVVSINVNFNKFSNERSILCLKSNGRLGFSLNWVAKKGVNTQQEDLLKKLKEKLKAIEIDIVDDYDTYASTWLSVEETARKADDVIDLISKLII